MEHMTLFAASILTIGCGVVHSWLGEVRLIGPLLSPQNRMGILEKSLFARRVLRFAWHITTLAWWGFAALLAALAFLPVEDQNNTVLLVIALTFLVTGLVALITSRGQHLSWPVFLAISGLTALPLL